MTLGLVVGSLWATRKDERLAPYKLLIIHPLDPVRGVPVGDPLVAADTAGAGAGERVLVARGGAARVAAGREAVPVDAAVVAIVDGRELDPKVLSTTNGGNAEYV